MPQKPMFLALMMIVSSAFSMQSQSNTLVLGDRDWPEKINSYLSLYVGSSVTPLDDLSENSYIPYERKESKSEWFPGGSVWLKIDIEYEGSKRECGFFKFDNSLLDNINLYERNGTGEYSLLYGVGDKFPHGDRPVSFPGFMLPVEFTPGAKSSYLIEINTDGLLLFDLNLISEATHFKTFAYEIFFQIFFYGIGAGLLIYTAISFALTKNIINLHLSIVLFFELLFFSSLDGYGFMLIWPDSPLFQDYMPILSGLLLTIAGAIMMRHMVIVGGNVTKLELVSSRLIIYLMIPLPVLAVFKSYQPYLVVFSLGCLGVVLLIAQIRAIRIIAAKDNSYIGWEHMLIIMPCSFLLMLIYLISEIYDLDSTTSVSLIKSVIIIQATQLVYLIGKRSRLEATIGAARLSDAERSLYNIINSIGNDYLVYAMDNGGRFTYASPSLVALVGIPENQILGHVWHKIPELVEGMGKESFDRRMILFSSIDARSELPRQELQYERQDGRELYYEVIESMIKNGNGEIVGFEGICRDKTEETFYKNCLAKAKEDAENALFKLENSDREKRQIIANLSHDLKTPLNTIVGYSDIIKSNPDIHDDLFDAVRTINRSGSYLIELIEDIIEISDPSRITPVSNSDFSLRLLMKDLEKMFSFEAENKGVELEFRGVSRLPDVIHSDQSRVRLVISHLLSNALRFTSFGSIMCRVSANNRFDDKVQLVIQIQDTGCGISNEVKDSLFSPFETKSTGARSLGLSICKKYADQLGGDLIFSSKEGVGSSFQFDFGATYSRKAIIEEVESDITGIVGNKEVLVAIIDPSEDSTDILSRILKPAGFKVCTGKTAFEISNGDMVSGFDLIIASCNGLRDEMESQGHMSGVIRKECGTPLICLYDGQKKHIENSVSGQPNLKGFLDSPFTKGKVLSLVADVLNIEYTQNKKSNVRTKFKDRRNTDVSPLGIENRRRSNISPARKSINSRKKIVIAESVEIDILSLVRLLKGEGYQCIEIEDMKNVVACITKDEPDVVIVNADDSGLSGISLIKEAQENIGFGVPIIIAITDSQDASSLGDMKSAGANASLSKPVIGEQLKHIITKELGLL